MPPPKVLSSASRDSRTSRVVYVNGAFERLTGYASEELLGQDLRRLQASDREQEGRVQLREAIAKGESTRALLRNYRKDGIAVTGTKC